MEAGQVLSPGKSMSGQAYMQKFSRGLFKVPVYFGLGPWWDLDPTETRDLGNASFDLFASLMHGNKAAEKFLQKHSPTGLFILIFGSLLAVRVMATFEALEAKKNGNLAPGTQWPTTATVGGPSNAGTSATVGNTIEQPSSIVSSIPGSERMGETGLGYGPSLDSELLQFLR